MLSQGVYTQRNQIPREQFRERGSDRFQESAALHQIKVGVDRESYGRQHFCPAGHPLCSKSSRFRQTYPALNAAIVSGVAVMIYNSFPPGTPEFLVTAARQND